MTVNLSRRSFTAAVSLLALARPAGALTRKPVVSNGPIPVNPLVRHRADAQVMRHADGTYTLTGSVPEYDRLVLRRSKTLAGLADAEERVLWRHEASGPMSGFLWAPELHRVDGRWVMYFAAGPSGGGADVFRIRTYAIVCDGADPMTGNWRALGQFKAPWDSFNLDSTSFVHKGRRWFAWAQREPGIETNSNLYLAPMKDALTLAAPPVRLSVPTLEWEIQGYKVNEAPAVLHRNGRLFLTYSASATDARYCLGMLTADENADLLDPRAWTKSPQPVLTTCRETAVYGPGHNSFTTDEQGRDVLVYHGRDYAHIDGDPLYNPDRHTRMQRIYYDAHGVPDFGVPVGNGPLPSRYEAATRRGAFLAYDGTRPVVGNVSLPHTQLRADPQADGSVTLSPILLPDRCLVARGDGSVSLAARAATGAPAGTERFHLESGPEGTVRWTSQAFAGKALAHFSDNVRLSPAHDPASLWRIS